MWHGELQAAALRARSRKMRESGEEKRRDARKLGGAGWWGSQGGVGSTGTPKVFEGDFRRGQACITGKFAWAEPHGWDSCPAGRALGDGDVIWMGLHDFRWVRNGWCTGGSNVCHFRGQDAGALLQCSGTRASCCCCEGWAGLMWRGHGGQPWRKVRRLKAAGPARRQGRWGCELSAQGSQPAEEHSSAITPPPPLPLPRDPHAPAPTWPALLLVAPQ